MIKMLSQALLHFILTAFLQVERAVIILLIWGKAVIHRRKQPYHSALIWSEGAAISACPWKGYGVSMSIIDFLKSI